LLEETSSRLLEMALGRQNHLIHAFTVGEELIHVRRRRRSNGSPGVGFCGSEFGRERRV